MTKKVTGNDLKKLLEGVLSEKDSFGTPPQIADLEKDKESAVEKLKAMTPFQKSTADGLIDKLAKFDNNAKNITAADLTAAYRSVASGNAGDARKTAYALKSLSSDADNEEKKKHDVNLFAALSARSQDPSKIENYTELFHEDPTSITNDDVQEYLFIYTKLPKSHMPDVGELSVSRVLKQDVFNFDLRNFQAAEGAFPDQLASVFEALVGDETNYFKRLKMVTDFSRNAMETIGGEDAAKNEIEKLGLQKFMQNIMALDYITTITKNLESGSAAYQFEAFLALLAGGKVTGKAPESEGEDSSLMGATDFEVSVDGGVFKGSAKYYSQFSGLSQSAKGFNEGEKIHYIIAIKKGEKGASQSNPDKIVSLDIHWIVIECFMKNAAGDGRFKYYSPLGISMAVDQEFKSKAQFDSSQFQRNSLVGKLLLVSSDTETFREEASSLANKMAGNFEQVFELTKSSIDDTSVIKDSVSKYSSTGKVDDGNRAVDKIVSLKTNVKKLIDMLKTLDPKEGYEQVDTSKISESKKITADFLKKLISESLNK